MRHFLQKKFKSPSAAEKHYFGHCENVNTNTEETSRDRTLPGSDASVQPDGTGTPEQLQQICTLFHRYTSCSGIAIPRDFLPLCLKAFAHLKASGRTNVLYNMSKCLGTMRTDNSDSLLPAKRMPMGLLEHTVNFFTSSSVQQVSVYERIVLLITTLTIDRYIALMTIACG